MEKPKPPLHLTVVPDSKLAQLFAMYADLKPAVDNAEAALKAVTDAIKIEIATAAPDVLSVEATSNGVRLRMTYEEGWRLDSPRMKREDPELYVRYAKKSGAWYLRRTA